MAVRIYFFTVTNKDGSMRTFEDQFDDLNKQEIRDFCEQMCMSLPEIEDVNFQKLDDMPGPVLRKRRKQDRNQEKTKQ